MTTPLKMALSPISCAAMVCASQGSGVFPPDALLSQNIGNFVKAWSHWRGVVLQGTAESSDKYQINRQCIDAFFAHLESICAKFPGYNYPAYRGRIFGLNSAIMTTIPWGWLPENIRKETLSRIFAVKEFRLCFWRDYLELCHTMGTDVQSLGMNQHVATALLEYEDIRVELLSLSLQKISLFLEILPALVMSAVVLVHNLWCYGRLLPNVALGLLGPLATESNKDNTTRHQANFFVADIYMAQRMTVEAKPHLDALNEAGSALSEDQHEAVINHQLQCHTPQNPYRGAASHVDYIDPIIRSALSDPLGAGSFDFLPLIQVLTQINQNLTGYLAQRKTDGFFYSLGIYNKQLSDKKNTLVIALQKDVESFITKLDAGHSAIDHSDVKAFLRWLVRAEAMNASYYQEYKRSFDGVGTLGGTLRSARECLEEFIAQPIANPGNAHLVPRVM
jgi:hypothetical protein